MTQRTLRIDRRRQIAGIAGTLTLVLAGCQDDPTQPSGPPVIDSPAAVVGALADAYRMLDSSRFERLISRVSGAEFGFQFAVPLPNGRTSWDAASELNIHRRMLVPPGRAESGASSSLETPVPAELQLASISIVLTTLHAFTEVDTPQGLDPARWRAFDATYGAEILFDTQGQIDFRVSDRAQFVVIEDLSKSPGEAGQFLLYRWVELETVGSAADAVPWEVLQEASWAQVRSRYAGGGFASPAEFVQGLADAYRRRDLQAFAALFHEPDAEAPYLYYGVESDWQPISWDASEELRIHRRMFEPQNPLAGETPVPADLWPRTISTTLTPASDFTERPDLYRSPSSPEGLDPERWRAVEAQYATDLLLDLQGPNDYRVVGKENFVVIDLRQRLEGVPGKYFLYRWEDLGSYSVSAGEATTSEETWTGLKSLYRN